MPGIARLIIYVTALTSLCGALPSTGGAATWHNTGSTSFTATGGPTTLSVGSNNLACTGSADTGSAAGGSTVDFVFFKTRTWSPCSLVGQSVKRHCTVEHTGNTFGGGLVTWIAKHLGCTVVLTASPTVILCQIDGTVPGSYTNPSGTTPGRFTYSASSSLTVTNGTVSCPLGTGTASVTEETSTITNGSPTALGPVINRTA